VLRFTIKDAQTRMCHEAQTGFSNPPASVWHVTARALCQQAQDRATGRDETENEFQFASLGELAAASSRIVNRERIQRAVSAGLRPCLFVEEWDKVSGTQFQLLSLFDTLDAITSAKGQLVLTSNLTWADFAAAFGGTSWRIELNCWIVEMFDKVNISPPKKTLVAPFEP
jgi:hypothetical protein